MTISSGYSLQPAMRASDADRDAVATVLAEAFSEGRLTVEEHAERLEAAMGAVTVADLLPLTADLVRANASSGAGVEQRVAGPMVDSSRATRVPPLFAVFSGFTREGEFRVPETLSALTLFGGGEVDFSDATLEAPTVTMYVGNVFGGMDIYVPEGVRVEDRTLSVFGGSDTKGVTQGDPNAPMIVLRGLNLFGGMSVWGPGHKRYRRWRKQRGRD